jgi:hypothetical protein
MNRKPGAQMKLPLCKENVGLATRSDLVYGASGRSKLQQWMKVQKDNFIFFNKSKYTLFLNMTTIILLNIPSFNILIDSIFGYLVT